MQVGILCWLLLLSSSLQGNGETQPDVNLNRLTETKELLKEPDATRIRTLNLPMTKRGWGSLLLLGSTIIARLGNLGVTIASVISEGCAFFPRICDNIKAIEKLEEDYKREKEDFKELFEQHNKNYVEYRTAVTNNGMIAYFINDTMKNIESLSEWQSQICAKLEAFFPTSSELINFTKEGDFKRYLLTLSLERLEYTLKDIRNIIQSQQKMQLIGMVVQLLSEATIYRFVKSFRKAYAEVLPEDIFDGSQVQAVLRGYEQTPKYSLKTKFLAVPKALKLMAKNAKNFVLRQKIVLVEKLKAAGQYTTEKLKSIVKSLKTEGWKGIGRNLKIRIQNRFQNFRNKVEAFKGKFQSKLQSLQKFKLSKFAISMSIISIISDVVSIGTNMVAWHNKDVEIEKSKQEYEKRLAELKKAKNELKAESIKVENYWEDVIESFKNTSKSFEYVMANLTRYSDFIDVVGLPHLSINNSESLLSVDFENVNKTNVIEHQGSVITFLRENDNNLTAINDALRARSVLYDYVTEDTRKSKGILEMTEFLHSLYRFDASTVVRSFGEKLEKKDVVCTVAIIRADKNVYDFYPLPPFRPRCEVNDTLYVEMDESATEQHNLRIMNDVIDIELQKESVIGLSEMLITVRNAYRIQGQLSLTKFADSISEKSILCRIAQKYTTLTEFDFIPLSSFRDNCTAISDEDLSNFKEKASKLKILHGSMVALMKTCTMFKICPCVSVISTTLGASEEDIKISIKQMYPGKKTYCGTGCQCLIL